jgi:hypothetical protein
MVGHPWAEAPDAGLHRYVCFRRVAHMTFTKADGPVRFGEHCADLPGHPPVAPPNDPPHSNTNDFMRARNELRIPQYGGRRLFARSLRSPF